MIPLEGALSIPADAWTDVEGDGSALLSTLVIDGCSLHLEAIATEHKDDSQCWPGRDEEISALHGATGAGGPWETVTIGQREYVLIATPYCE